ncbi:hypothetical protein LCGC14_3006270 [marine sediment metagenome]|uniref:Uncharacterized protein n=1 Tax=marine sediment metagenome TaxID=412755 RepID=A0A0F8ZQS1_9ZZZZ
MKCKTCRLDMKIHCSEYGIHECEQFIPSEEFFMTKKNVREELLKSELPENNSNHSSDITLTNKDPEGIARLSPAVNSGSDILLSDKRKEVLKKFSGQIITASWSFVQITSYGKLIFKIYSWQA